MTYGRGYLRQRSLISEVLMIFQVRFSLKKYASMKHKSEMVVFNKLSNSKRLDKIDSVSMRQFFTSMRIHSYKV